MNINSQIKNFLDDLLGDYEQTPELLEQKEELATHLTERVHDHMQTGYNFTEAFEAAIRDLGDINELVAGIVPQKASGKKTVEERRKKALKKKEKSKKKRKEKEKEVVSGDEKSGKEESDWVRVKEGIKRSHRGNAKARLIIFS